MCSNVCSLNLTVFDCIVCSIIIPLASLWARSWLDPSPRTRMRGRKAGSLPPDGWWGPAGSAVQSWLPGGKICRARSAHSTTFQRSIKPFLGAPPLSLQFWRSYIRSPIYSTTVCQEPALCPARVPKLAVMVRSLPENPRNLSSGRFFSVISIDLLVKLFWVCWVNYTFTESFLVLSIEWQILIPI